jgi:hypothetical protein
MGNHGPQWELVGNYVPKWEYRWAKWSRIADVHALFLPENRDVDKSVGTNGGRSWETAPPGRPTSRVFWEFVGTGRPSRGACLGLGRPAGRALSLFGRPSGRALSLFSRPSGRPGGNTQHRERFTSARAFVGRAGAQAGGAGHHHQQDGRQAGQAPTQTLPARRRRAAFSRIGSQQRHHRHHTGPSQAGASPLAASQSGL